MQGQAARGWRLVLPLPVRGLRARYHSVRRDCSRHLFLEPTDGTNVTLFLFVWQYQYFSRIFFSLDGTHVQLGELGHCGAWKW